MSNETAIITFYGASDDLVEFEGGVDEEFDLPFGSKWRGLLVAPNGEQISLTAKFGRQGWELGVIATEDGYPSWPITFSERPGSGGDPAIVIDAPLGTEVAIEVVA